MKNPRTNEQKEFFIVPKINTDNVYFLFRNFKEIQFEILPTKEILHTKDLYPEEINYIKKNIRYELQ